MGKEGRWRLNERNKIQADLREKQITEGKTNFSPKHTHVYSSYLLRHSCCHCGKTPHEIEL